MKPLNQPSMELNSHSQIILNNRSGNKHKQLSQQNHLQQQRNMCARCSNRFERSFSDFKSACHLRGHIGRYWWLLSSFERRSLAHRPNLFLPALAL